MATKAQERRQRVFTIVLAVMVTFSLAGLGSGFFNGAGGPPAGGHNGGQTANVLDATQQNTGRVVCVTGDAFNIVANLSILIDGEIQPLPSGIGVTQECILEIRTEDDTGDVHITSDVDKGYAWSEFFVVWGIAPSSAPGFILLT
ncbi:MAG: hypothetical protein IIB38_13495, partial [Candidatus Hydrogenedentes bacterium]|nr:hypothetical protein [Candidatus Hydrogenedentota bacterium]